MVTGLVWIIAATIYMESEGEPFHGKYAVASVIENRVAAGYGTAKDVCLAPGQFSAWRDSKPVRNLESAYGTSAWTDCVSLAGLVAARQLKPAGPWTHFYATKKSAPHWRWHLKNRKVIGNHAFGRL